MIKPKSSSKSKIQMTNQIQGTKSKNFSPPLDFKFDLKFEI